jgi:cytochrome c-type biogenesis protein CcmH/NrfF
MSFLWAIPPVVLILGAAIVFALLRSVDEAGEQLLGQLKALAEVNEAVALVRAETARTRRASEELHRR